MLNFFCLRGIARAQFWRVAAMLLAIGIAPAFAGPGHDHGPEPVASGTPPSPRVVATSGQYQLVGIAEGEVLVIYLDRAEDNAPVTSAVIELSLDGTSFKAAPQKNGTYEVTAPILRKAGSYEVLASITDGDRSDLLVGAITVAAGHHDEPAATSFLTKQFPFLSRFLSSSGSGQAGDGPSVRGAALPMAALIGAGILIGLFLPRRGKLIAALFGITVLLVAASAYANEGHDHGPDASASSGNAPQRRPDGTLFLPKPSQRLLEVRTRKLEETSHRRTARLTGRIVANPNFSGVVQSTIQGRYLAPAGGVPALGRRIAVGDLLGTVAPSFASIDASDMAQRLGEIDQQIALSRSKLERLEPLLKSSAVSRGTVDETRIQLEGYLKRREELLASRVRAEELRAPVEGVIAAVKVVSGQVVSQTDQIFQIVNPAELYVEGLVFDQIDPDAIVEAEAIVNGGTPIPLAYVGRSRAMQQQYSLIQFRIAGGGKALNVGMPVTIVARTGEPVSGLFLPRSAVTQAPNGQPVVFVHKEPEVFVPTAVRSEIFDAQSVLILGGAKAGDSVVVQNAPLVNQVR